MLPADAREWDREILDSVLSHEATHVRRGDVWKQLLVQVSCCLWWFHPLAWMAADRATRAREQACDDAVLGQGTAAEKYADHLISVARSRRTLAAAASLPFGSQLERRVLAVLDESVARRPVPARTALVAGMLAAMLLLPFSGMSVWADEVHKADEEGVAAPKLIQKVEPVYTEEAQSAGIEGTVVLYVEVSPEGVAENVRVTESLDPGLDANAVAAVEQWRFEPGTKHGKPVRIAATIEINYRLR